MSRQLTGNGAPRPPPAPPSHASAPLSTTSSSASSSSSSAAIDDSSFSTQGWGIASSSNAPTTALTSPSSSSPVSPFASPVALHQHHLASVGDLANAEEGHAPHPPSSGTSSKANGWTHSVKHSDAAERFANGKVNGASSGKPAGSGHGAGAEGDWDELVLHFKAAARAWRKTWEKEGLAGITSKLRRTSFSSARRTLTSTSPRLSSSLRSLPALVPPRRRLPALITLTLLAFFLLIRSSETSSASAPRASLQAPLSRRSRKYAKDAGAAVSVLTSTTMGSSLRPDGYPRGVNKAKMLESQTNPYGFMNLVDPYAGGVFNPSILVLPDQAGLGWRHLLVARGPEKYEVIQGEDTRWQKIYGCFLLPLSRAHLHLPYLARESELETLNLPARRKVEYQRCENPTFDQFIGPEDPRLFFTNDGQPLLIFSQTGRSPMVCRALFIIDARMVIPGLDKALKKAGWNPPVQFREQTDLIRENQFNIEKNWSPFLGENDELFFHVSLVPQQIYKYVPNLTLRPLDPTPPAHNCLTDLLGADMNRVHVHHASPLLRATLCKRGECVPDVHNTVLFGIVHVKYHPLPYLHYVRHVVTWNVTSPYEYLSVSKPLTYSGTNQADPIFTVGISWDHPSDSKYGLGLNHGFLDDNVLISFGVADYGSAYIDVFAHDLLTDHEMCAGVGGSSLWRGH